MDSSLQSLDQARLAALDMAIHFGPKLVVALFILGAGYFAGRWVARMLDRVLERWQLEAGIKVLLARIARILVLGLFAIMALQNLGIELLPLLAGLGLAGAGVALAMQGILSNIAAGLTIIFTRPFLAGDYISIVGEEGEVLDISLFSTTLGHPDRSRVVIPNRKIVGEILHNYGEIRQMEIEASIAYGSDLDAALHLVDDVLRANPRILRDPAPAIGVARLGESGIAIRVAPWTKLGDYAAAISEVNKAMLEAFAAHAITIPLPQREIRLLGAGN